MFVYIPVKVTDSDAIFVYIWCDGVATSGVDLPYPEYICYGDLDLSVQL